MAGGTHHVTLLDFLDHCGGYHLLLHARDVAGLDASHVIEVHDAGGVPALAVSRVASRRDARCGDHFFVALAIALISRAVVLRLARFADCVVTVLPTAAAMKVGT